MATMTSPATVAPVALSLHELRAERLSSTGEDRCLTARHLLAIVAEFAGEVAVSELAMAGYVGCEPGESTALAAERQVRALAREAETQTRQLTGRFPHTGDVVCGVLAEEYLLDDYLRVKGVEQHLAFDD